MSATIQDFLHFVQTSPSPSHVAASSADLLRQAGFQPLNLDNAANIQPGGKYYSLIYGTALLAFTVGRTPGSLRIAAAHTDFPCLRLKPQPVMVRDNYISLNIESYGGMVLRTWLDRPLSLAGKVALRGTDAFHPVTKLVDFASPMVVIPGLAIHFDRDVNEQGKLNCQTDLLPLAGLVSPEQYGDNAETSADVFRSCLAKKLNCATKDILAYELSLYPVNADAVLGINGEFVSAPRLDNLTSVWACLQSLAHLEPPPGLRLVALFDNEEVGSRTKQGAGSTQLWHALSAIYHSLDREPTELYSDIQAGFMLSVDVAHATHPNHGDKTDPQIKPQLGGGVVFKEAAAQTYAGDAEAVATVKALADECGIKWQEFVNRADQKGGSTLGSIASAFVPIRTMDIGTPILAMHSAVETMAIKDQLALNEFLAHFMTAQ